MTTQQLVITDSGNQGASVTTAVALGNADISTSWSPPPAQQAYFNLQGTVGSPAATATVEASFDGGTTWVVLKDNNNVAMSYTAVTANPIPMTLPAGALLRFHTTGGTGTSLNAFITYAKAFI
jgi:hypothetical protein